MQLRKGKTDKLDRSKVLILCDLGLVDSEDDTAEDTALVSVFHRSQNNKKDR